MNTPLIDNIVALAHADKEIRAVILEGSLATHLRVDELSDYDINLYTLNAEKYLVDDRWLSQIGEVLLYQKEQFQFYDDIIPTRLVLFRNRERVDFSFWRLGILSEIVRGDKVYESYRNGYQILLDKDHLAGRIPPPDGAGFSISPPSRERFRQTLYDFWFNAYCAARYLWRRDLWYAKLIENRYIKDRLFQMALWNHQTTTGWQPDPLLHTWGKGFEKWASPELIEAMSRCFSPYDVEDTWQSLLATVELFNQLARETSISLQIEYPYRVEQDILDNLQYIKRLADNREESQR